MFKVSGISSKAEIGDDEEMAEAVVAESSRRALTEVLGAERRDRILSALYLARQDAVNVVRQSSIHIWKALVHNTPRTGEVDSERGGKIQLIPISFLLVREILPELVGQLVKLCSSDEFEQQEVSTVIFSSSDRMFLICWERRPQRVRPLSCVASLAKRFWARSFRICKIRSRRLMRVPGMVYASCCRTSCRSIPL